MAPAMAPVTTAPSGFMVPVPAVIPTNPASTPLPVMATSSEPALRQMTAPATTPPAAAAKSVVTAALITKSSAASSEPGLNPNQPNHRMNTPSTTKAMLCPGRARGLPFSSYLPMRGPKKMAPIRAAQPPVLWTMVDPAKSPNLASPIFRSDRSPSPCQKEWTTTG